MTDKKRYRYLLQQNVKIIPQYTYTEIYYCFGQVNRSHDVNLLNMIQYKNSIVLKTVTTS